MNMVKLEIMVGTFMIIGMLCLGYISVKLGKLELGGGDFYTISAGFDSVSGLKPGARVEVDGESIIGLRRSQLNRIREKFGMLFQNVALFDSMSCFENVAFPLQEKTDLPKDEIRRRVLAALEDVGLKNIENKFPDELSGGMKKRVGLARAVVLNPKIILFDEPTTGLDPIIKRAIHQLIKETHARFGFTAVIVSHEIPGIFDVAQNVAMLYKGKILQHGSPDEINNSDHPAVRQFISGSLDGPIQLV